MSTDQPGPGGRNVSICVSSPLAWESTLSPPTKDGASRTKQSRAGVYTPAGRWGRLEQGRATSPRGHFTVFHNRSVTLLSCPTAVLYHSWTVCTEWSFLLHCTWQWEFMLTSNWHQSPSVSRVQSHANAHSMGVTYAQHVSGVGRERVSNK